MKLPDGREITFTDGPIRCGGTITVEVFGEEVARVAYEPDDDVGVLEARVREVIEKRFPLAEPPEGQLN